ncbi:MAG TPA: TrkA family potassium uptake protein [Bacteroidales bacterium]|nr:TrkA family potassium uptake protein [Bacteroidales bacterium]HPS16194.1 TrkA family potassium uptake protein [Bacteroidales bacterium]
MMHQNKFAVIGLGQFGKAIALTLANSGGDVLAIDSHEENVQAVAEDVSHAVTLDASDKKALKAQNIQDMDAVVVAIGEDFESLLLCCVVLLELKVKRIIARARGKQQRIILEKIGIKEVLSPEDEVGILVAERLLNPSLLSVLKFPDQYEIVEIKTPRRIANRNFSDVDFMTKYKLNIVAIKREFETEQDGVLVNEQHVIPLTPQKTILYQTDTLLIFGKTPDIEKFLEINQ